MVKYRRNEVSIWERMMTPYWFTKELPPTRHGIENAVRLSFWAAGFGDMWITCVDTAPPFKCQGVWRSTDSLTLEWVPKEYLLVRMKQPNQDALTAFERVLGHKAFAAYREQSGDVAVEWRVKGMDDRYADLKNSGAQDLERLS
jgi:hypothetical protein